ncbi:TPA: phage major capsid protein [Escherichia coli]|nr:phage major capsid protein [Escherichia coli]HAW9535205.1 phage major capsid protein [Escherichia coli]
MAVDIKDVEQVAQELQQKFDDFKAKNDKRVEAIEQEKGKLAGQVETLNGKLSELENLKSDLEKELLELKRPAGGAQNKLATEHKEAFVGFLRKGREDGLRDLERKALQVGTDEDGGYAVPEELDRNILNLLKDEVVMRQEATVITVGGSDYKKLVNLGGTASGWVGETDTRSQTATSRLELIEPLMGEIYGNPQATQKMLDDAFFNVEAWINSELATEFAEQEEIAFTSGDGTKKPKGFLAYESTDETDKVRAFGKLQHIVSGDATAVTADAIIKLIYTLRKAHRTGAKFMMNNNSLFAIRLLKDTEGNYLWRPGLELGQPSSLAGYGIAENEQMPDIAADAKAIAFGNFKRGYARQLYGHVYTAKIGTLSELVTAGDQFNQQHITLAGYEKETQTPADELAASRTARAAVFIRNDPARPTQTGELVGMLPAPKGKRFTMTEQQTLLSHGVATAYVESGVLRIQRDVTTYRKNAYGVADNSYLDSETLHTSAYVLRKLKSVITSKYGRHKLASDGTRFGPGQAIVTPAVIKGELLATYRQLERAGIVENYELFKQYLVVERDASDPNRLNTLFPPDYVNQLRVFAVVNQFRLQYSEESA